ncbi:hypothetical protein HYX05_01015 [Candidatus Woesearchaeota archaeon]|nr:hypothetical protein [Candidatus Woesearchaeota archaeon]
MFRNKKAFTLQEAITLALVAVILVSTVAIVYKIYSSFTSERDDGSLANFEDGLIPKVQELLKSDKKLDYTQINYFIGAAAIVGYNKAWDSQQNLQIIGLKIEKPNSCSDKACLCFFKQSSVLSGNPYKPCIKFDKVAYFLKDSDAAVAYSTERAVQNIFYDSLVPDTFKTEYKYMLLDGSNLKQKSQAIYIEKYQNANGEFTFYFAPVNDATRDKINKRKAYIDSVNK